jgi:GNAT superfamily N-acetyltransferase
MPAMAILERTLRIDWRSPVSDDELVDLTRSHGGRAEVGWWDRVRPHSLGWVTARTAAGELVGFVNVAWDGGDHAFLIDTKTRPAHQRQGLGVAVVSRAIAESRAAGCEWLFVDFEPALAPFYLDACGFRHTAAGLVHLPSWAPAPG